MKNSEGIKGCLGCLFWVAVLIFIFSSCQNFFNSNRAIKRPSNQRNPVHTAATDPKYKWFMEKGYKATDRKAYQEALGFFQKALALYPGDPYAQKAIQNVKGYISRQIYTQSMQKGYKLFQQEKYAEAVENFLKALGERPDDSYALKALKAISYDKPMAFGSQLIKEEDYQTAFIVFENVLKQYPNDSTVMEAIKPTIRKTAVQHFKTEVPVPKITPKANGKSNFYGIAMFLSSKLAKEGRPNDALIIAERIYREHPNDEKARQVVSQLAKQTAKQYTQRLTIAK